MQSLKKTTILPAKFGKQEAKPEEKIKENLENKENKENLIFQKVESVKITEMKEKVDNRKKENPRNESKAFKIDKELDNALLDLMEEYGITTDSDMIFQLLNTHPLLSEKRNKAFFEIEENKVYLENLEYNKNLFAKLLGHSRRRVLANKRAARS